MSIASEMRRKAARIHKPSKPAVEEIRPVKVVHKHFKTDGTPQVGRPKKVIDYDRAYRYGLIHCTMEEISTLMGISLSVLQTDKHFQLVYQKGLDKGKKSLRRKMYELAAKGNVTMLVWLSKNLMGFRDNKAFEISGRDGKPVTFKVVYDDGRNSKKTDDK